MKAVSFMENKSLENAITNRYSEESKTCDSLSCGDNFSFLNIEKGEIVLDLGCGRGKDTIRAAEQTGKSGFAIGLDLTAEMVEKAKQNAFEQDVVNVSFTMGNIENLPFENDYFNKVLSNCVINHAKDKKKVYSDIYRILKVGGSFVISDAVTKYPLPNEIKNSETAWAECFGGAVTEEEYMESIQNAGFDNIQIMKRREYLKNGYDFISLTIKGNKSKNKIL